jgi:hypothetical protein
VADGLEAFLTARGENCRPSGDGDLDGHMTDAASASVNENRVARSDRRAVHQAFPGGDGRQRQRGSLGGGQPGGLDRQQVGVDGRVLGQ